jgi:hypothetical protein
MTLRAWMKGTTHDPRLFQADGAGAGAGAGNTGGATGAGAAGAGAGAASGGAADGSGGAGGSAGNGGANGSGGQGGAGQSEQPWYETRAWSDPALKEHLLKNGYHSGTAEEALERALKGDAAAQTRLGKPPGSLLDAPKEGQGVTDWLKANAKAFGVPEKLDDYKLALPQNLPEGAPLDETLMADWRGFAHGAGLPPQLAQAAVDFFGQASGARISKMITDATNAETALTQALQGEWGQNYQQNQQLAARAFQTLAAEMKLDPEQTKLLGAKLNGGMGDPVMVKFFHHLAGKMGEDTLALPRGANAPQMQRATAEGRKAQIMAAHTGDMALAARAGNSARIKELQAELNGLNTIIAQHG